MKTTRLFEKLALKAFGIDDNKVVGSNSNRTNKTVMNLSKKSMYMSNIGAIKEPNLLTPNAKKVFNHLQLAFIKTLILQYFNLESYIWIKINISGYIISKILD